MKLVVKLLCIASAAGIVLILGTQITDQQVVFHANPFKTNHQQFERIQKPGLVTNTDAYRSVVSSVSRSSIR